MEKEKGEVEEKNRRAWDDDDEDEEEEGEAEEAKNDVDAFQCGEEQRTLAPIFDIGNSYTCTPNYPRLGHSMRTALNPIFYT